MQFKVGDRVEVSAVAPDANGRLRYTVPANYYSVQNRRSTVVSVNPSSFGEFDLEVPSVRAMCVRAAGGIARERASLPPPAVVSYRCNYRGTLQPAFGFTLVDRSSYHDDDRKRGTYRYDTAAKRVVFESGPNKDGTATGTYCTG